MFIYALSIFLTSTAVVSTNKEYGIPLSRYAVFFKNCPLGYNPIRHLFLFKFEFLSKLYDVEGYDSREG